MPSAKVKLDGVVVDHFNLGDALAHRISIRLQALIQQKVVAKGNVMRRQGLPSENLASGRI